MFSDPSLPWARALAFGPAAPAASASQDGGGRLGIRETSRAGDDGTLVQFPPRLIPGPVHSRQLPADLVEQLRAHLQPLLPSCPMYLPEQHGLVRLDHRAVEGTGLALAVWGGWDVDFFGDHRGTPSRGEHQCMDRWRDHIAGGTSVCQPALPALAPS